MILFVGAAPPYVAALHGINSVLTGFDTLVGQARGPAPYIGWDAGLKKPEGVKHTSPEQDSGRDWRHDIVISA